MTQDQTPFAARREARVKAIEAQGAARRAAMNVIEAITLAVRDHRRRLGLSQRAYAALRGWSKSFAADLEAHPGPVKLETVLLALSGTGFTLAVVREPCPPMDGVDALTGVPVDQAVPALAWSAADLVARTCDGRRLPAHHEPARLGMLHTGWFTRHGYVEKEEPQWTWRRGVG